MYSNVEILRKINFFYPLNFLLHNYISTTTEKEDILVFNIDFFLYIVGQVLNFQYFLIKMPSSGHFNYTHDLFHQYWGKERNY